MVKRSTVAILVAAGAAAAGGLYYVYGAGGGTPPPPGTGLLQISASPLTIPSNGTTTVTVIATTATGTPIQGIVPSLYINGTRQTLSIPPTDASGISTVPVTIGPVGTYNIQAKYQSGLTLLESNIVTVVVQQVQGQLYTIAVTVREATTGQPIAGATVVVNGEGGTSLGSKLTDASGLASFGGITVPVISNFYITVSKAGYRTESAPTLTITQGVGQTTKFVTVNLTQTVSFAVQVKDAISNSPIAGATVMYGGVVVATDTGGNASITTTQLSGTIQVTAQGYVDFSQALSPVSGQTYTLAMTPTGGIPLDQSFLFVGETQTSRIGAVVTYKNVSTTAYSVVAWITARNSSGQTIGIGSSQPQTVIPGQTTSFLVSFFSPIPGGTYTFLSFITSADGSVVLSLTTSRTVTV